jgi:hypothetical protein
MKLMTQAIIKKLPPLRSTDGKPANERKIICKFFSIVSQARLYVLEGNKTDTGDYELYTYSTGNGYPEFGYSMLSELQNARWRSVPAYERDLHFEGHTLQEVLDETTF